MRRHDEPHDGLANDVHQPVGLPDDPPSKAREVAGVVYTGRTIFDIAGITEAEFRRILEEEDSVTAAARRIDIDRKACARWARRLGFTPLGHRPKARPNFSMKSDWGASARWFREHPGEKLPANLREAAELAGISYSSLTNYISRRKQKGLKFLRNLGPLQGLAEVLTTTTGLRVPLSRLQSYELDLDPRSLEVTITGKLGALGDVSFLLSTKDYVKMFRSA